MNVSIHKKVLLQALQENLEKHKMEYREALEGYNIELKKSLRAFIREIEDSEEPVQVYITFPVPQSHVEDYERVIHLMSYESRDTLVLEEHEARQYLNDEWGWKQQFSTSNAFYSGTKSSR